MNHRTRYQGLFFQSAHLIIFFSLLLFCGTTQAQFAGDQGYPSGYAPSLDAQKIKALHEALRARQWACAMRTYYGQTYNSALADVVIYISPEDSVQVGLLYENEDQRELRGQKYLWVCLFSSRDFSRWHKSVKCDSEKYAFKVRRESLQYEAEPSEGSIAGLIGLITQLLAGTNVNRRTESQLLKDDTVKVELERWSSAHDTIYIGHCKFALALNSETRIVATPAEYSRPVFRSVAVNFGNFEASRLGVAIGVGYNCLGGFQQSQRLKAYLSGLLFLHRPALPVNSFGVALLLGTNLNKSILSDLLVGARVQFPWFGSSGLFVGAGFGPCADSTQAKRKPTLVVGIDYRL